MRVSDTVCDYCKRSNVKTRTVWLDVYRPCRCVRCSRSICKRCDKLMESCSESWLEQRRSKVEVLSSGAEEIVRSQFSKKAIREDFEFKVTGPTPTQLDIVFRWVKERVPAEYVERSGGGGIQLYEVVDTPVLFTLAACERSDYYGRNPMKATSEHFGRFWSGVSKLAKAARVAN